MDGFENKEKAWGTRSSTPQGNGGKLKGGKVPYVSNPTGQEPTSHGSQGSSVANYGHVEGQVGK